MPTVQVASRFDTSGDTWQFTSCVATADKDWAARGGDWNAAFEANVMPMMGLDTLFLGSQWGDPYEQVAPGQFVPATPGTFGGRGSPSLPPSAPLTVSLYTDQRGRGKQGRWFMAGVAQGDYAGGLIDPTSLGNWQTAVDGFVTALNPGITFFVARMLRSVHPPTLIRADPVIVRVVQRTIRVQKRREFGRSIRKHKPH